MCSIQEQPQTVTITTVNESLFISTDVSQLNQNNNQFIAATKLCIAHKMDFLRNMALVSLIVYKFTTLFIVINNQHIPNNGIESNGRSMI